MSPFEGQYLRPRRGQKISDVLSGRPRVIKHSDCDRLRESGGGQRATDEEGGKEGGVRADRGGREAHGEREARALFIRTGEGRECR